MNLCKWIYPQIFLFILFFIGFIFGSAYGNGWVWQNQKSQENTLTGVWGSTESDVFAVGYGGTILHYDGFEWRTDKKTEISDLLIVSAIPTVWGSAGDDVYSLWWGFQRPPGEFPVDWQPFYYTTIAHYDGIAWKYQASRAIFLSGIWGSAGNDIFTVGDGGTILHYDGIAWTAMSSGTTNNLSGICGSSGSDVFAVGDGGTILHYDGIAWTVMPPGTTNHLSSCWGNPGSDIFTVGDGGTILHYDGIAWTAMSSGTTNNLSGICGSSRSDVFAVGEGGTTLHYDGIAWTVMPPGTTNHLSSCWGNSKDGVFAVGENGTILHYTLSLKKWIYRNGSWLLDANGNGVWDGCELDVCYPSFGGYPGDVPIVGAWTGDKKAKIGIYRNGAWYLDSNGDGAWDGCEVDTCLGPFGGMDGDVPVVGDWTGTEISSIGIYRQGMWYLDLNGNGVWDGCELDACLGPFGGMEADKPVAGDWTGDGKIKIGIFRNGAWYLDANGNGAWDGCEVDICYTNFESNPGDVPVVGDWTGDGKTKLGVYRFGAWYLDANGNGTWDGCEVDTCIPSFGGDWSDIPLAK